MHHLWIGTVETSTERLEPRSMLRAAPGPAANTAEIVLDVSRDEIRVPPASARAMTGMNDRNGSAPAPYSHWRTSRPVAPSNALLSIRSDLLSVWAARHSSLKPTFPALLAVLLLIAGVSPTVAQERRPQQRPPSQSDSQHRTVRPDFIYQPPTDGYETPSHAEATGTPLPRSNRTAARSSTGIDRKSKSGAPLWSTLGALSFIIALIVVAARLLKKHGPAAVAGLPPEALEPLGKHYVDPRNSIHFIRCGSRILVLGLSPHGFQTLTEVTDPVEVNQLAGACRRQKHDSAIAQSFRSLFQQREADDRRELPPPDSEQPQSAANRRYDRVGHLNPTAMLPAGSELEDRHG
jgi:flagellar biogenesis protein FliO